MRFSVPADRGGDACGSVALGAGLKAVFSTINRTYAAIIVKNVSTPPEKLADEAAILRVLMVKAA